MARADAQSAAQESGYSDAQRAEVRVRLERDEPLGDEDRRVVEIAQQRAHYVADAASARSNRAREMQEEFERVYWGTEPGSR